MIKIIELIHFGKISESGYPEIDIHINFKNENIVLKNLKAFIDTGANGSAIQEDFLKNKIDLSSYNDKDVDSANGEYKSKIITNIGISLPMNNNKYYPLDSIGTIKLDKLKYDFILGNDILHQCEFIYNGLSRTYILKLFQTETNITINLKS